MFVFSWGCTFLTPALSTGGPRQQALCVGGGEPLPSSPAQHNDPCLPLSCVLSAQLCTVASSLIDSAWSSSSGNHTPSRPVSG